ncbi:hypothetical protein QBC43DRAFT_339585 [Cladorrhinum sp. PSN259]|nr:hypothetical protein QBC43DRAFT_339585 [Cladorrhinum sp. PSN259]
MAWECDQDHFCECGHLEDLDGWTELLQSYSERQLTRRTDKLPAIHGLAQMIAQETFPGSPFVSVYLSGFFRRAPPMQLAWRVDERQKPDDGEVLPTSRRPSPYRAPSWSWASVDDPVKFAKELETQRCVLSLGIRDVDTCTVSGNQGSSQQGKAPIVDVSKFVPVALVTAERSYQKKLSLPSYTCCSDFRKGRATLIRPAGGRPCEISRDECAEIKLRRDGPSYNCWVRFRPDGNAADRPSVNRLLGGRPKDSPIDNGDFGSYLQNLESPRLKPVSPSQSNGGEWCRECSVPETS